MATFHNTEMASQSKIAISFRDENSKIPETISLVYHSWFANFNPSQTIIFKNLNSLGSNLR